VIPFGEHYGEPAWQEVPGEHRAMLRPTDRDPGRHRAGLGRAAAPSRQTAPSLYDLRNLFQVNVEEGRASLGDGLSVQKYFGRDGREEADELLRRRLGDADSPRMLGAVNEKDAGLAVVLHVAPISPTATARWQLHSLSQSGFDPLSRTCRFILTKRRITCSSARPASAASCSAPAKP